jgi:hypothetical protein
MGSSSLRARTVTAQVSFHGLFDVANEILGGLARKRVDAMPQGGIGLLDDIQKLGPGEVAREPLHHLQSDPETAPGDAMPGHIVTRPRVAQGGREPFVAAGFEACDLRTVCREGVVHDGSSLEVGYVGGGRQDRTATTPPPTREFDHLAAAAALATAQVHAVGLEVRRIKAKSAHAVLPWRFIVTDPGRSPKSRVNPC